MRLVVYGEPAPQGSKKTYGVNKKTGKTIFTDTSPKLTPWRSDVKSTAERYIEEFPVHFAEAVSVRMVFTFRRPASVSVRRRHNPSVYPDLSKLARSTEDALTAAGVWEDDALVVNYTRLAKVYAGEDLEALDRPGCIIIIQPADLTPPEPEEGSNVLCHCCGHPYGGLRAREAYQVLQESPRRAAA